VPVRGKKGGLRERIGVNRAYPREKRGGMVTIRNLRHYKDKKKRTDHVDCPLFLFIDC
jgi:hypothetical protein